MNKREKLLAIVVGALVALVGLWYLLDYVTTQFRSRTARVEQLEQEMADQQTLITVGTRSLERYRQLEERALPNDSAKARSLYQTWLLDSVDQAGLEDANVNAVSGHDAGAYYQHTFNLSGQGDLLKLVDFLYKFYAADHLHRIKRMTVKPADGKKRLDVTFTIDVISIPSAPDREELLDRPSNRLGHADVATYQESILRRNLYGPPNTPPQLEVEPSYTLELNTPGTIRLKAEDEDDDRLTYDANLEELPDAELDQQSGELRWTPRELGDYFLTVSVSDDGLPSGSDDQEIKITVVEPTVTEAPTGFDKAKYSIVTGILDSAGAPEIWITLRTEGKTLKLREGESFEIGDLKGMVRQIRLNDADIELDGKLWTVRLGKSLRDATEVLSGE